MRKNGLSNVINKFYKKHAYISIVIFFGVIYLINQAVILTILSPLKHEPLLLQLTFSKSVFSDIIIKWGEQDLLIYRSHYYFDFPHAIIYAIFLSSTIAYLTYKTDKITPPVHIILFMLPYFAGFCDIIENTIHLIVIQKIYDSSELLIILSAAMATTKWVLAGISILAIIYFLIQKKRK